MGLGNVWYGHEQKFRLVTHSLHFSHTFHTHLGLLIDTNPVANSSDIYFKEALMIGVWSFLAFQMLMSFFSSAGGLNQGLLCPSHDRDIYEAVNISR